MVELQHAARRSGDDHRPRHSQDARGVVDEDLEPVSIGSGHVIDQLEFPVGVEQPAVGADGVDTYTGDLLGSGDERVGKRSGCGVDDEVVDRITIPAFDDLEGQYVGAHGPELHGEQSKAAGAILEVHA